MSVTLEMVRARKAKKAAEDHLARLRELGPEVDRIVYALAHQGQEDPTHDDDTKESE